MSRVRILESIWEKPVITFYQERFGKIEKEAFVAIKARKLIVARNENNNFNCRLEEFFPIIGSIDCISTREGMIDSYVLCWFDDKEDDFSKAFRRLTGVTFSEGIKCVIDERGKRTCISNFEARGGKLE